MWSEVVCFVNSIRTNFKNYYLSCPNCRKKATEETDGMCIHCNKHYVRAQYRYILNVNLVDAFDNIWATAYDEVAEVIMGINGKNFPADEFVTLS